MLSEACDGTLSDSDHTSELWQLEDETAHVNGGVLAPAGPAGPGAGAPASGATGTAAQHTKGILTCSSHRLHEQMQAPHAIIMGMIICQSRSAKSHLGSKSSDDGGWPRPCVTRGRNNTLGGRRRPDLDAASSRRPRGL